MENRKFTALYVRETQAFQKKVNAVADALNTTTSQFIRDAITEKMERHAERNPKVARILDEEQAA
jgi:predicted transcriptional regulator